MIWLMIGMFVAGMIGIFFLIDYWINEKYNPEKKHEAQR